MAKFVKLTSAGNGEPAYTNVDRVSQISPDGATKGSVIFYDDGVSKVVTQTPEEIIALIEA